MARPRPPRRTRPTTRVLILLLTAWAGAPAAGAAPGPRVYRDSVQPHWYADGRRFWYRNDLAGGRREFVRVDAEKGSREPAFDHARVAAALAAAGVAGAAPDRLPVEKLEFTPDEEAVRLTGEGRSWLLDLSNYSLRPGRARPLPA